MGKTYRGGRKTRGVIKAKQHKQRAKWKRSNGTRLRTLTADLIDFQQEAGFGAVPFHASSKTKIREKAPENKFREIDTSLLVEKHSYAKKQTKHLHRILNFLGVDNPFLEKRKKHWDRLIQLMGHALKEREDEISSSKV